MSHQVSPIFLINPLSCWYNYFSLRGLKEMKTVFKTAAKLEQCISPTDYCFKSRNNSVEIC